MKDILINEGGELLVKYDEVHVGDLLPEIFRDSGHAARKADFLKREAEWNKQVDTLLERARADMERIKKSDEDPILVEAKVRVIENWVSELIDMRSHYYGQKW